MEKAGAGGRPGARAQGPSFSGDSKADGSTEMKCSRQRGGGAAGVPMEAWPGLHTGSNQTCHRSRDAPRQRPPGQTSSVRPQEATPSASREKHYP